MKKQGRECDGCHKERRGGGKSRVRRAADGHTAFDLTQREILRDVMLSAAECRTWLTLHELAQLTKYGEASISAQLRHLRKREFGGYFLQKRLRRGVQVVEREHGPVWEYQLRRGEVLRVRMPHGRRPAGHVGVRLQLA